MGNVNRVLAQSMTVEELIEELQQYPAGSVVVFGVDYGDIGHTEQALPIGKVELLSSDEYIDESAYSQSGISIEKYEDEDSEEDEDFASDDVVKENSEVVILRM